MDQLSKMGFVWRGKANQFVGALWPRSNRAENFKYGVGYVDTYLAYIKEKGLPVTLMLKTKTAENTSSTQMTASF